jgi:NADPH2:quinone reductase
MRFVRELGADVVINRKKESIPDVLSQYSVDVALDCVAGPWLGPCLETMAYGGRWIVIATLGGSLCELNMLNFFKRGVKLIGSTLRSKTSEMKAKVLGELEKKLWPSFSTGKVKVLIHKKLPITNVEEAHVILQNNENSGKVVLMIK